MLGSSAGPPQPQSVDARPPQPPVVDGEGDLEAADVLENMNVRENPNLKRDYSAAVKTEDAVAAVDMAAVGSQVDLNHMNWVLSAESMASKRPRVGDVDFSYLLVYSHSVEAVLTNVDLLTEILLRVPAKTLGRLKRVSKEWLSFISNPQFVSLHTQRSSKSPISGLYITKKYWNEMKIFSLRSDTSTPSLSFLHKLTRSLDRILVKDSCNGLLLCCGVVFDRYLVCNPITHKYTLLPSHAHRSSTSYNDVLVFDPLKSPFYKVVLLSWPPNRCNLQIYSSDTASWKQIEQVCAPIPGDIDYVPCLYWEGGIHWMMSNKKKENSHYRFDVDAEKLEVIPLDRQPRIYMGDKIRYFGVCGGRLILIQNYKPSAMGFKILEMGSGCRSWSVKCNVRLKPSLFPESDKICRGLFSVVHVVEGEKGDDLKLVLAAGGKLSSYDIKLKKLEELSELPPCDLQKNRRKFERMIRGYKFVESLAAA